MSQDSAKPPSSAEMAAGAPVVRRPGRPRSAQADAAILEATFFELIENGYAGLSMDKVAARAGVSKATIYRRWPSREELILDAWRSLEHKSDEIPDTGTVRNDLLAMCELYESNFSEEFLGQLPQMLAAVHQSPQLATLFRHFVDENMTPLYEILQRGVDRGELRPDLDVRLAATQFSGPLFFAMLFNSRMLEPQEMRSLIEWALRGITAQ